MSTTRSIIPDNDTDEQVFKPLNGETTALFERLDLSFLTDIQGESPVLSRGDDPTTVTTTTSLRLFDTI